MPDPSKPVPLEVEAVEAAAKAYRSIMHVAIGAAPEGMDCKMAYYFYERVEQGRGYGEETHPPLPCPNFDNPRADDYPVIVAQAAILAADEARGMRVEWSGIAPNVGRLRFSSEGEARQHVKFSPHTKLEQRTVSRWFPVKGPVDE